MRFDSRVRSEALNINLYGFDPVQNVTIARIRQAYRRSVGHFLGFRKTYVLAGFTEPGTPFRHPVEAMVMRKAITAGTNDPTAVVAAAQRWTWENPKKQLSDSLAAGMRHVYVLLVRAYEPRDGVDVGSGFTVGGCTRSAPSALCNAGWPCVCLQLLADAEDCARRPRIFRK